MGPALSKHGDPSDRCFPDFQRAQGGGGGGGKKPAGVLHATQTSSFSDEDGFEGGAFWCGVGRGVAAGVAVCWQWLAIRGRTQRHLAVAWRLILIDDRHFADVSDQPDTVDVSRGFVRPGFRRLSPPPPHPHSTWPYRPVF